MTTPYAPEQAMARGHTLQINDIEMYYEAYGSGRPLVLLHGFGGGAQNWHPFVADLSRHYRLIVIDLRGHGYSTNPGKTFTHRQAASDVFHLLERLEVNRFSAMGMSSGAMTLLHMATEQPERIDSLVLVSTTTHFPDQARAIMRRASFGTMPNEVKEMYRACAKRGDTQIHQLIAQFNAFGDDHEDMNFTEKSLSAIKSRTLVVHGDRDRFFPVEIAVTVYRAIPDAALWVIPGGDHVPIFDSSIPFASTAIKFLEGPAGR